MTKEGKPYKPQDRKKAAPQNRPYGFGDLAGEAYIARRRSAEDVLEDESG